MLRSGPTLPGIPGIPGLPDFGDLWDRVQDLVGQAVGAVFNGVVDYIWDPVRPYLEAVHNVAGAAASAAAGAGRAAAAAAGRLFDFFEHGTDYVALWLVHGFLKWVDAIVDLVEDYIDSHWDD